MPVPAPASTNPVFAEDFERATAFEAAGHDLGGEAAGFRGSAAIQDLKV
jgi:hypothetical protein